MRRKHKGRGKYNQRESKHKRPEKRRGKPKVFNFSPTFTQENISHPDYNVLHFPLRHWHTWSTSQKIAVVVVILVSMGMGFMLIYHCAPIMVESFNSLSNQRHKNHPRTQCQRHSFFASSMPINQGSEYYGAKQLSGCDARITSDKTSLETLTSNIRISIDSKSYRNFRSLKNTQGWEAASKKIRELLPNATHPELLSRLMDNPNFPFHIMMTNQTDNQAYYLPLQYKLIIPINLTKDKPTLLIVLRQLLHDVTIHMTHEISGRSLPKNIGLFVKPYLTQQGTVDFRLYEKLAREVRQALFRFTYYKTLQLSDSPHKTAKAHWQTFLDAIKTYQPFTQTVRMTVKDYNKILSSQPASHKPTDKFPAKNMPSWYFNPQQAVPLKGHVSVLCTQADSNTPEGSATAFFKDTMSMLKLGSVNKSQLQKFLEDLSGENEYKNVESFLTDKECSGVSIGLSRIIASWPDEIRALLAKEWTKYFEDFYAINDPSLSTSMTHS